MMNYRRFFLLIFLCFVALNIKSQESWSLEKCIDYALSNNIQLKIQSLSVESGELDLLQSKGNVLPNLNGNASHAFNYGQTIDPYTNTFATERVRSNNFYMSSSVTIFNGFQLLNSIRKSQIDLLASRYDLDKMKDDVALQIATAYLNILYNMEMVEVSRSQLEITNQQVDRTRKMVEAGTLAKGTLLTIEAQAATEELQLVNSQNQLDLSYLILAQLLDLPGTEGFKIEKPDISLSKDLSLLAPANQIYEYALENQPEIKSAELRVESSEKGLLIARGTMSPSLMLSGSAGTGYSGASKTVTGYNMTGGLDTIGYTIEPNPVGVGIPAYTYDYETVSFQDQIEDNFNKSFGFYLSVPIFNGLYSRTSINKAKIGVKSSEYNLEMQMNELYKTIQQAYADAVAAYNEYKAAGKSVAALQEAFKYTEQKFNVGMVNTVEYNDAKNKLIIAKSDLLRTKYNFVFRKTILDFYQGKTLSL